MKTPKEGRGYANCNLTIEGKYINVKIHKLVAKHFIPNIDNKPFINHIDGIKTNNNVSNLEWVTPIDNTRHGWDTGLNKNKGETHPLSVYTDEQIHEFCNYIDMGYKNYEICSI